LPRSLGFRLRSRTLSLKGRGEACPWQALWSDNLRREKIMPGPFGDHQLKIPYEPVAGLLAKYARRDPDKTAIVDLETGASIDFGRLETIAVDIAAYLKSKG